MSSAERFGDAGRQLSGAIPPVGKGVRMDIPDQRRTEHDAHILEQIDTEARLAAMEEDFRKYELENRHQPPRYWNDSKMQIRSDLSSLRMQFRRFAEHAPEAWSEMRWGILAALQILETGYRRTIREFHYRGESPRN